MYKVLILALVCLNVESYGENNCKVPNGDAGRCVNIARCRPLWEIYNKKRQTPAEDNFIRQSICSHRNSPTVHVCCPSIVLWQNFEANPVVYHNPLDDISGDTQYYPTAPPTTSTTTRVNVVNKANVGNSTEISTTSTNQSPKPITTITETETKINEVLPLTRDSPNITDMTSNNEDVLERLGVSNRNNKMSCGDDLAFKGNRITGGTETAIDEYPWLVLLEYNTNALACGGSLITSRFVLTAAHCANSRVNGIPAFVRLSEYNTTSFPTDIVMADGGGFEEINVTIIPVEEVWAHPNYKNNVFMLDSSQPNDNDIGLVKLTRDAEFSDFIDIVCLPHKDFISEFVEGLYLNVAGWGEDRNVVNNDVKKHVEIPFVPLDKCRAVHSRALVDSQICAGGEKGKDSCVGDSGGPLMYKNNRKIYLVGIVSYGNAYCGAKGLPGVYTNVYKYLRWINDIVNSK